MNHQKMYRQIFGCGQLIDNFEKVSSILKAPTMEDYNNLPEDIKSQYKNYNEYRQAVELNNATTKTAMIEKITELKTKYKEYTKGSDSEKMDFDTEADVLISKIENTRKKINGTDKVFR